MLIDVDELLLQKCRQLIEEKLRCGSSIIWTNSEYMVMGFANPL